MSTIVNNWFITPKNKLLAGDLNGKTYNPGLSFDRVKKTDNGWIIGKKMGVNKDGNVIWQKYVIEQDKMDTYFSSRQHHLNNIISYLNNFSS